MRMCHFQAQNSPICPKQIFFGTNHYYQFHLPIGPFHCAKFKKILTVDPELWRCTIFGPKMVHLPQTIFFWKMFTIILIYLSVPFIVQNLKIFGPKMAHLPKLELFQTISSWALFLLFMSIFKVDINLLVE